MVALCLISIFDISTSAEESSDTNMDELSILLTANSVLNTETDDYWTYSDGDQYEIIPLYNKQNEISAYYVHFSSGGYAVVNNNINNPVVLEFGEGDNNQLQEIINNNAEPHIIYNSPFSLYEETEVNALSTSEEYNIYDYYPDLKETNSELANQLKEQKAMVENNLNARSDYGFINWDDMDNDSYTSDNIDYLSGTDWITTYQTEDFGNNHCGTVCVSNLALYFENAGKINTNATGEGVFIWAHQYVGNGPNPTIASAAKDFFADMGYNLNYQTCSTTDSYKTAISASNPCGILLANGIVDWHWILGVGWRQYSSGELYFRIVDGWNDTANRFYRPYSGSLWISATRYWL